MAESQIPIDVATISQIIGRDFVENNPQINWRGPIKRLIIKEENGIAKARIHLHWSARWIREQPWWVNFVSQDLDDFLSPEIKEHGPLACSVDLKILRASLQPDLTAKFKRHTADTSEFEILPSGDNLKPEQVEQRDTSNLLSSDN